MLNAVNELLDARARRDMCERLTRAFVEHHPRLLARARRLGVDQPTAEEVVQEAFLRAWRAAGRFDPAAGPILPWLLAITTNVAKDVVRARARRSVVLVDDVEQFGGVTDGDIEQLSLRDELGA